MKQQARQQITAKQDDETIKLFNLIFSLIKEAFNEMGKRYSNDMKRFYPTVGSRGINERNLVHWFLVSLSNVHKTTASWMEIPFIANLKGLQRIDGVVYIEIGSQKNILLIEAKRIKQGKYGGEYNTEKAKRAIKQDWQRLGQISRINFMLSEMLKPKTKYSVFRIMLADIWVNNEPHMKQAKKDWLAGKWFQTTSKLETLENEKKIYETPNDDYTHLLAFDQIIMDS